MKDERKRENQKAETIKRNKSLLDDQNKIQILTLKSLKPLNIIIKITLQQICAFEICNDAEKYVLERECFTCSVNDEVEIYLS